MRLIQAGMIGFVLVAVSAIELLLERGQENWDLGYWVVAALTLWGVSAGYRIRRLMVSSIERMPEKDFNSERIQKRLNAGNLIFMASASSAAYWGLVVRLVLHGTFWQAAPFYALGIILLLRARPQRYPSQTQTPTDGIIHG